MRIIVVDFAASYGGAMTILKSFYDYLIDSNDKNEWFFFLSGRYIEETENIHVVLLEKEKQSRLRRLAFDFMYGRKVVAKYKPDAVFYLQNTLIHGVKVPQIAYMDQLIPFQKECSFSFFDKEQRPYAIYQYIIGRLIKDACREADRIIVQTEWIRKTIAEECMISIDKIVKISAVSDFVLSLTGREQVMHNPIFFYPASGAFYKNHRCVIDAVKILNEKGICNFSVEFTLEDKQVDDGIIKYLGQITHENVLKSLKENILVFPSYIESYGLPLAEAKSVGGLILAADTDFAHEILDGYPNVYYFSPFKPKELAEMMERIIEGEIVKKELVVSGGKVSNPWERVVEVIKQCGRGKIE